MMSAGESFVHGTLNYRDLHGVLTNVKRRARRIYLAENDVRACVAIRCPSEVRRFERSRPISKVGLPPKLPDALSRGRIPISTYVRSSQRGSQIEKSVSNIIGINFYKSGLKFVISAAARSD